MAEVVPKVVTGKEVGGGGRLEEGAARVRSVQTLLEQEAHWGPPSGHCPHTLPLMFAQPYEVGVTTVGE